LTNDAGHITKLEIQILATNQFPFTAQPQSPAADVLFALSKYDPAIEELRKASRLPYSRFPLNYDVRPVYDISLPHLQTIKNCAQVLQLRSVTELTDGQTEKAFDDVVLILRLANSIRDEPLTISQLVRVAILNLALQPIWEGLAENKWSDAQLAVLENELSRVDFVSSYQLVVRAQRTFALDLINSIMEKQNFREVYRGLLADAQEEGSLDWRDLVQTGQVYLMPRGWFYENDVFVTRIFQQSLLTDAEIIQQIISPSAVRRSTEIILGEFKQRRFYDLFVSGVFPPLARNANQMAFGQASADLARTSCALERYHLAHGDYPETLDALAPQFIAELPHDIINGQQLHYRREANGQFVLYSVGWNETDDDGQIVLNKNGMVDREKGDWVWQYPQK
jgi:hypothetical protein